MKIKAKNAIVEFTPPTEGNPVIVIRDKTNKSNTLYCSHSRGAVFTNWEELCEKSPMMTCTFQAWDLASQYKIDPQLIHEAFMNIEEYNHYYTEVHSPNGN
jgi:hypothetical protein